MSFLSQILDAKKDLAVLHALVSRGVPLSSEEKESIKKLASSCSLLKEQYHYKNVPSDQKMLGPVIDSLALITNSFALKENGAAPLFLGMNLARIASESSQSKAGFLGPTLSETFKEISRAILVSTHPKADSSSKEFFESLITISLGLVAMGGLLLNDLSKELLPKSDKDYRSTINFFTDLAVTLLFSTTFFFDTFKMIAAAVGIPENKQKEASEIGTLIAKINFIQAAAYDNPNLMDYLLENSQKSILESLNKVSNFIGESVTQGILEGTSADLMNVQIQQAKMALERDDKRGFEDAFHEALILINSDPENLKKDMQKLYEFTSFFKEIFIAGMNEQKSSQTEVYQSA
jgi:hypothetical protein